MKKSLVGFSLIIIMLFNFVYIYDLGGLITKPLNDTIVDNLRGNTKGVTDNVLENDNQLIQSKISTIPVGWSYESLVTINPVTPSSDYQIKLILTKENFNYSQAVSDGRDIRFYDTSNPLDYWIEEWDPLGRSVVWVKVPTAGISEINMYYGNPSALSESNGDNTFIFFDDFEGTAVNLTKWTTVNGVYSSSIVSGGVLTVTTNNPDERNGGAMIGFNDFYLTNPGASAYNAFTNNCLNFGTLGRGHQIYTKAAAAGIVVDNALTMYSWETRDIRWISDSLVQYNNGSSIITHTNSTCIPDMPLQVRILTHATWYGPGYGCSGAVRSINAVGETGRALRTRTYYDCAYNGLAPPSIQIDWVAVRECTEYEPAATIVNDELTLTSPEKINYNGAMAGYYPASYGFESDPSFPYVEMTRVGQPTLSGQPPEGWIPHYPGQTGKLRVIDEYMGHTKVVELRKSRGSFGKARVGMTTYFPTSATTGTIEFWFNKDSDIGLDATKFILLGTGGSIELGIENQALYRGVYPSRVNISEYVFPKDTWKHIRVDFEIGVGWQVQLDSTWYGSGYAFPFEGIPSEITGFDVRSHGSEFTTGLNVHDFYFDALGYSWDPSYTIGDNLNEGILLDFEPITRSRTDWEGYYPASEGYDYIPQGGQPDNWGYWQGGSTSGENTPAPQMYVLDSKTDGYGNTHKRVLYCQDNSGGTIFNGDGYWDEPMSSGTVDFWFLIQNNQYLSTWGLLAENSTYVYTVRLGLDSLVDDDFSVWDGTTRIPTGIDLLQNKWYRFSVDFSDDGLYSGLAPHTYRIRWYDSDGTSLMYTSPDLGFYWNGSSTAFHAASGDSTGANMHLDALGFSWDPNYNIGDNRFPAVYEGPELAPTSWIGYSLDGQPNVTISGATTIPMPSTGTHSLQLFLNDSSSNWYSSPLHSFAVGTFSLVTPESKTYGKPMTGYYPGTVGFEDEVHATNGLALDFLDEFYAAGAFVGISVQDGVGSDPFYGHYKTLTISDAQAGSNTWGVHHFDNPPASGTLEFLVNPHSGYTGATGAHYLTLRAADDTVAIQMRTYLINEFSGRFEYLNGSLWISIADYVTYDWYQHSISFDCAAGTNGQFTYIIRSESGIELGRVENIEFQNNLSTLDELYLGSDIPTYQLGTRWDAFGFSWEGYSVGDNLNEGILISYGAPTPLDWTAYSLDGGSNVTIQGNYTIPLPSVGTHTIQVVGFDSLGIYYSSDLRVFDIISPDPPSISGPGDFSFNYGDSGYSIIWSVSDPNPANFTIYQNGTIYQSGTYTSIVIASLEGIDEGIHNFTCIVQNDYGLEASDEVWVTVIPAAPDTVAPTISSPIDITFEEGSIGYSITWNGADNRAPWWASVWRDGTLIYSQAWIGNDIEISLEGLAPGTYEYNCTLFDEAGNSVFDIVLIYVLPAVPDTDAPTITPHSALVYEVDTTGNTLTWVCDDAHPYAYRIIRDTTELLYAPWHGGDIVINVDGLAIGAWTYNLTLWDLAGNSISAIVDVIVTPIFDITPPVISQPAEIIIAENTRGTITWEVFDDHPSLCIVKKNGTIVHSQSYWSSGILQYSFASLSLGTWEFTVTLWDEAGNSASSSAIVQVLPGSQVDTIAPEISHHPVIEIVFGSVNNSVTVYLFDQHPGGYSVYLNSSKMLEAEWIAPNIQVKILLDDLTPNDYTLEITAWDTFGNTAIRTITISVTGDITPPVFTSPAPDQVIYRGSPKKVTWEVSEANPDRYEILNLANNSIFKQDTWNGEDIQLDLSQLMIGTHNFRCVVYDVSGNFAMDDVVIMVKKSNEAPGFDYSSISLVIMFAVIHQVLGKKRRKRR